MSNVDYRQFFCMSCGAKLKAKAAKAGKELPCPKCAAVLVVPGSPASTPANSPAWGAPTAGETYGVREAEAELRPMISPGEHSGPVRPVSGNATNAGNGSESYAISDMSAARGADANMQETAAEVTDDDDEDGKRKHRGLIQEPSVRPTPPRWPLVQGVLGFMLEPGAIVYWAIFSMLGTVCASLLAVALVLGQTRNAATWTGSMLFGTTAFMLSIGFLILNSITCLAILQESAAGNKKIEEWPGMAVFEYFMEAFFVINSLLGAVAIGWFLSYPLAGIETARATVEIVCFVAFFPILLLSMLESESFLVPVSLPVYAGIRRSWRTWLVFYIESMLMTFGLLAIVGLMIFLLDHYSAHVTIPIALMAVAVCVAPAVLLEMLYFRLLGRLAWVCDEDSRRELAEEEAAEEEEEENAEETEIRSTPVDDF